MRCGRPCGLSRSGRLTSVVGYGGVGAGRFRVRIPSPICDVAVMATHAAWPATVWGCVGVALASTALMGCGGSGPQSESVAITWRLIGVGPDGRSLLIENVASTGGCDSDPFVKSVQGSDSNIRVEVAKRVPTGDDVACTANARDPRSLVVRLDRAVNGQRISGPKYLALAAARPGATSDSRAVLNYRQPPLMRRVVGLRLSDARRVLRAVAVARPRVAGDADGRSVVVDQSPAAGRTLDHRYSRVKQTPNHARLTVRR